jgi:[ribosomal protein S5]-alanine N-acetyltransferase
MNHFQAMDLAGHWVSLTHLHEKHIPDMFEYSCMPEFYKHMEYPPHTKIEETQKYFDRLMDYVSRGALFWAIVLNDSDKMIGSLGIRNIDLEKMSAEISIGVSPLYWFSGISFEALYLGLNYTFNALGFKLNYATTSVYNRSMIKILEHLGYEKVKTLQGYYRKYDGNIYDGFLYKVTDDEFRQNLQTNKLIKLIIDGKI